jgi:hypothetical protein
MQINYRRRCNVAAEAALSAIAREVAVLAGSPEDIGKVLPIT